MPDCKSQDCVTPVVAGLIRNTEGQILLARRPVASHQGGLWEFPGGKVIPGENQHQALARELAEELGITIKSSSPLASVLHHYPEKTIQLSLRAVHHYQGSIHGREGQDICWWEEQALASVSMPAADRSLVNAVSLPEYYLITGQWAGDSNMMAYLDAALQQRRKLIQLRLPGWTARKLTKLAENTARRCREYGAQLLINEHVDLAAAIAGAGVHLKSWQLMRLKNRPLAADRLVAASCHNETEVVQAGKLGLDFICLSAVLETPSHPGAAVLGWERFASLCQSSSVPVFALGGLSVADLGQAREAGAVGVAGISGFWSEP